MDAHISAKLDAYRRSAAARQAEHESTLVELNSFLARLGRTTAELKASTAQARQSRIDFQRRVEAFRRENGR
jgi:hypothetical protein